MGERAEQPKVPAMRSIVGKAAEGGTAPEMRSLAHFQTGSQDGPSMAVIGIMLAFRWYMIHIEPVITISTSTAVKT